MNKLLVILIACLGMVTTACDDAEFSSKELQSKVQNLEASDIEVIEDEEMVSEEIIEEVVEEMILEEVIEIKEPIKETMAEKDLADTYLCSKNKKKKRYLVCHINKGNQKMKTHCKPESALKAFAAELNHSNNPLGYMGPCKEDI